MEFTRILIAGKSTFQEGNFVIKLEYRRFNFLAPCPKLVSRSPPSRVTANIFMFKEALFAVKDSFLKMKDPPLVKAAVVKATDLYTK